MNLKRTTIIPLDDTALATSIFKALIEKEMMIVMIILGDTTTIRKAIDKADKLAQLSYFNMERWVLWVRNHDVLAQTLKKHLKATDAEDSDQPFENIKCFCFSPVLDQIEGIILKNGKLNFASLQKSFFEAQSHDVAFMNS